MNIKNYHRLFVIFSVLVVLGSLPVVASAEIIDDITVNTDANGEVDTVIKFTVPIQYTRHFPQGKTPYTAIYFNVLGSVPPADWQNYESHRTPPSAIVKDVTVSTMDKTTGPQVQIQFVGPVEFKVTLGSNGQSLRIHIKPGPGNAIVPTGDITAPTVVLPLVEQKIVHIPLGGKDGLPNFPNIEQDAETTNAPPSEHPTLTEQVVKANNQASGFMIQGGNALLTGQAFGGIEAFNSILNLPPNKYSEDAQLWIGIARERVGQLPRAILEFNAYLKLFPKGKSAQWVKDRLAFFKASQPSLFNGLGNATGVALPVKNTEFQQSEFGSLSMEYYYGTSKTDTMATVGAVQTPTTITSIDQKSVMTNVNMTARSFNNEYDNRLVFQDFYAANFLPGQVNSNRLGSAYYEMKDRVDNYSVKIGRQSGMGGGVMGRFDGVSAGYAISPDYKLNIVAGQLSDVTMDEQPRFNGVSLDFGLKNRLGGSVYYIDQTVYGITDRRAIGGNARYFEPEFSVLSMMDYDLQVGALNMITVQGTINGGGKANDYNFLLDRRRSPILDLRNAVSGSTVSFISLIQAGMTTSDLAIWANSRTTTTNSASVGMVQHIDEKWNTGTDVSFSSTDAMDASGLVDATNGNCIDTTVGCVAASPSSGPAWSVSQRLTGIGIFQPRDVSNFSLSLSRTVASFGKSLQFSNHSDLAEKWTLDSTMGLSDQSDNVGGDSKSMSPSARVTYKFKTNITLDSQLGLTWTKTSSAALNSSSSSFQDFLSFGFRYDF